MGIGSGGIRPGTCWPRTASARADDGDPGRNRASRELGGAAMSLPADACATPAHESVYLDQSAGTFDCAGCDDNGIQQA